jgi:single-stranded-DNA-specific exonuclease
MTLPASALPVESPLAFLGVSHSATGKLWRDRLDARGAARALAIVQRHQLPEMLARVLAGAMSSSTRWRIFSIRPSAN